MRDLESAYTAAELDSTDQHRLAGRFGLEMSSLTELAADFVEDLDAEAFGFRSWISTVPAPPRILIADHMVSAAEAALANLLEAETLVLAAENAASRVADRLRAAAREGTVGFPPPSRPSDEIPSVVLSASIAASTNAVAASLDCLAVLVIGVLGLPYRLLKADWLDVRAAHERSTAGKLHLAAETHAVLSEIIDLASAAGPNGWLSWIIHLRNMLVHRPRQIFMYQVRSHRTELELPPQVALDGIRIVSHLPRHPALSGVEALSQSGDAGASYLDSDGLELLRSVVTSAASTVTQTAALLRESWRRRISGDLAVVQPFARQWPFVGSLDTDSFAGYNPGTEPFPTDALLISTTAAKRMQAAAILDSHRHHWGNCRTDGW